MIVYRDLRQGRVLPGKYRSCVIQGVVLYVPQRLHGSSVHAGEDYGYPRKVLLVLREDDFLIVSTR